jgi:hypothetical protein
VIETSDRIGSRIEAMEPVEAETRVDKAVLEQRERFKLSCRCDRRGARMSHNARAGFHDFESVSAEWRRGFDTHGMLERKPRLTLKKTRGRRRECTYSMSVD